MSVNKVPQVAVRNDLPRIEVPCIRPLGPYLQGFEAQLLCEGYSDLVLYKKRLLVRELNGWLVRHNVALTDIDEACLQQFVSDRRQRLGDGVRRRDAPTVRQLLRYLRGLGCVPAPAPVLDKSALGKLTRDFERYMRSERGLSPTTITGHLLCVRRFLAGRFRGRSLCLRQLRARDMERFILREAQRVGRSSVRRTLVALRCFLRYALQRGAIKTDLAIGLPAVATWRLSHLPKSLTPDEVERLLGACDGATPDGQRDHAILLLLARLGLRAGEVGRLTLDDVDWEHGEIVAHTKRQRIHRLPLPKEVGAALARYLRYARPDCQSRTVFITQQAPWRGLCSSGIGRVVRRALRRAGLKPERKGAHLLRHSLATNMLRTGASLREIGLLLGHECPTTTQIYAKVDIKALRTIAMPWMGHAP